MGRKELKKASVVLHVIFVLLILSLTTQRITAARRHSKALWRTPPTGTRKSLEMEDDPGDAAAGDDYGFYRNHGGVPSPGVGH
jgi:hypothetical protein